MSGESGLIEAVKEVKEKVKFNELLRKKGILPEKDIT
jgi:hypothetical protein